MCSFFLLITIPDQGCFCPLLKFTKSGYWICGSLNQSKGFQSSTRKLYNFIDQIPITNLNCCQIQFSTCCQGSSHICLNPCFVEVKVGENRQSICAWVSSVSCSSRCYPSKSLSKGKYYMLSISAMLPCGNVHEGPPESPLQDPLTSLYVPRVQYHCDPEHLPQSTTL